MIAGWLARNCAPSELGGRRLDCGRLPAAAAAVAAAASPRVRAVAHPRARKELEDAAELLLVAADEGGAALLQPARRREALTSSGWSCSRAPRGTR